MIKVINGLRVSVSLEGAPHWFEVHDMRNDKTIRGMTIEAARDLRYALDACIRASEEATAEFERRYGR